MPQPAKTIQAARSEIRGVLRRYRLRWEDVSPDRDAVIWRELSPVAKRIRRALFRARYPSLNAKPQRPR